MKKLLIIGLLLLVPSFSFAATYTPAQISAMEQLLVTLEQELTLLLGQGSIGTATLGTESVGGTPAASAIVSVQPLETIPPVVKDATASFEEKFSVTTGNQTIDIPQNAAGIQVGISNAGNATASYTFNCAEPVVYSNTEYCEIAPNTTSNFYVVASVSYADLSQNVTPQMSITQLKYYTNVNNGTFSYYPTTGLTTGTYLTYQK